MRIYDQASRTCFVHLSSYICSRFPVGASFPTETFFLCPFLFAGELFSFFWSMHPLRLFQSFFIFQERLSAFDGSVRQIHLEERDLPLAVGTLASGAGGGPSPTGGGGGGGGCGGGGRLLVVSTLGGDLIAFDRRCRSEVGIDHTLTPFPYVTLPIRSPYVTLRILSHMSHFSIRSPYVTLAILCPISQRFCVFEMFSLFACSLLFRGLAAQAWREQRSDPHVERR